jgi:hypothetical protein
MPAISTQSIRFLQSPEDFEHLLGMLMRNLARVIYTSYAVALYLPA